MDGKWVALTRKGAMLTTKPEPAVPLMMRERLFVLTMVDLAFKADDSYRVSGLRPHARSEPTPLELAAVDC